MKTEILTIRVNKELQNRIDKQAKIQHRTRSNYIEIAIENQVDSDEKAS